MTTTRLIRSVAGVAMLGIGSFILRENTDQAAAWFHHVLGVNEGLGLVTAVTMEVMRGWQAYALDRLQFVHDILPFALALCRSLLLIVGGAFLSRDIFADHCDPVREPGCGNVGAPTQISDVQ